MGELSHPLTARKEYFFTGLAAVENNMPKLKRGERGERATDFVESLDRGLRLLQKFGVTSGPMTLSDLARAAELPRATARRILFTLEHSGFVSTARQLFT